MRRTSARTIGLLASVVAGAGVISLPALPAAAAVERFHRFEVDATANYTIATTCDDGSTAQTRVTVIGGREKESVNRTPTLDNQFVTVFVQSLDCDGTFASQQATGEGDFSATRSLSRARVTGTATSSDGTAIAVVLRWTATSDLERNRNVTAFPGFRGVFVGRERDASATGLVTIDGVTLVDGSTDNAGLETLEDRNATQVD